MDFQDLIGQWVLEGEPHEPETGMALGDGLITFYPPKSDVPFKLEPQNWPATYQLQDNVLTVTFQALQGEQTLKFDVLNKNSIRDSGGYTYHRCSVTASAN